MSDDLDGLSPAEREAELTRARAAAYQAMKNPPPANPPGPPPNLPANWLDPSGWWWDGQVWHPPAPPAHPPQIPFAPPRKSPRWDKGTWIAAIGAGLIAIVVILAMTLGGGSGSSHPSSTSADQAPVDTNTDPVIPTPADSDPAALPSFGQPGYCETTAPNDPACNLPTAPPSPAAPAETAAQSNAVTSAQQYLAIAGFSRQGLINQLVQGNSYAVADATYAVDKINPDYNVQATKAAKAYLSITGFSHQGLVDQLIQGDNYTPEQAEAGVTAAGL